MKEILKNEIFCLSLEKYATDCCLRRLRIYIISTQNFILHLLNIIKLKTDVMNGNKSAKFQYKVKSFH